MLRPRDTPCISCLCRRCLTCESVSSRYTYYVFYPALLVGAPRRLGKVLPHLGMALRQHEAAWRRWWQLAPPAKDGLEEKHHQVQGALPALRMRHEHTVDADSREAQESVACHDHHPHGKIFELRPAQLQELLKRRVLVTGALRQQKPITFSKMPPSVPTVRMNSIKASSNPASPWSEVPWRRPVRVVE